MSKPNNQIKLMDMFEQLSANLNLLMDEGRVSADELGRRTGLPASTIKKIRNRYSPNPTLTTLLPLAQYFAITLDQLIGNEPLPQSRIKGLYQINPTTLHHLPILSWEEAVLWPENENKKYNTVTTEHQYSKNAFALTVEEDGWENLAKGTALLIDPALTPEHRDFILVYKGGQKIPVLRQALFDEEQMYLKPLVKEYNITILTAEHKLLGVVVEYKKNLKTLHGRHYHE